jgi:hypothetical protein
MALRSCLSTLVVLVVLLEYLANGEESVVPSLNGLLWRAIWSPQSLSNSRLVISMVASRKNSPPHEQLTIAKLTMCPINTYFVDYDAWFTICSPSPVSHHPLVCPVCHVDSPCCITVACCTLCVTLSRPALSTAWLVCRPADSGRRTSAQVPLRPRAPHPRSP